MKRLPLTRESFIQLAESIHNNKYNYELIPYKLTHHSKITIICPIHGEYVQRAGNHVRGSNCKKCATMTRIQTNMSKYGTAYPAQSLIVQEKSKQTCLEKYGVEYPQQSYNIRTTTVSNNIKKYGVDNIRHIQGVDNKIKQTCLEKYGVDNPRKSKEVQTKLKQTWLEKYGVDNPGKSEEIKNKIKQTCFEKYGTPHHTQKHMIDILYLVSNFEWLFDQYIVTGKTATQISIELGISDVTVGRYLKQAEIDIRLVYQSYICKSWLDSITKLEKVNIHHEFPIPTTRYKADGYCEETNTIYEFYGDYWHGNPKIYKPDTINESCGKSMGELYQKTIDRENQIILLGYNLIVHWETNIIS